MAEHFYRLISHQSARKGRFALPEKDAEALKYNDNNQIVWTRINAPIQSIESQIIIYRDLFACDVYTVALLVNVD